MSDEMPERLSVPWRGWYYSGAAPHWDTPGVLQFITFRLADSLPQSVLRELARTQNQVPANERERWRRGSIERWLDSGLGCCALAHPKLAAVMQNALLEFDGQRYRLVAWCIMPNHVHVLIEPRYSVARIVQSWKSYTARWALLNNVALELGIPTGKLWMRDYWDRYIRDEKHFDSAVHYIHNNPVKAGLCARADEWRWSSVVQNKE